jgi:hypothetical protein
MQHRNWRELAEAVGFVTIVAVLVMIALEERSANRIAERVAEAEAQRSLAAMHTSLYMSRATNAEVAKVFAKMSAPQGQLITVTDASQMRAIAEQYFNIYRAAQFAHDRGLLPDSQLEQMRRDLEVTIDLYPGLRAPLVDVFRTIADAEDADVLAPIARLAADETADGGD